MRLKGALSVSVLAASVAAVGLANPAFATDDITQNAIGTYETTSPDGTTTWVVTPCEDGANQCIRVTEFAADDTDRTNAGWSGKAYWQVGWWTMQSVDTPDALTCDDGTKHSLPVSYSWDAAANTGSRSVNDAGLCGGEAASDTTSFSLTKIGPPPLAALPPAAAEAPLAPAPPLPAEAPLAPAPPLPAEAPLPAPPLPPAAAEAPPGAPAPAAASPGATSALYPAEG